MGSIVVKVDTADLRQVGKTMASVHVATVADLPRGVKAAAAPMVAAVKQAAGFSRRIPRSIKLQPAPAPAGGVAVQIVADAAIAPHAAPINNRDRDGDFTHPVYGRGEVKQTAHPFFHDHASSQVANADEAMSRLMDEAARKAGFR